MNFEQPQHSPEEEKKAEEMMNNAEKDMTEVREEMVGVAGGVDRLKEIYEAVDTLTLRTTSKNENGDVESNFLGGVIKDHIVKINFYKEYKGANSEVHYTFGEGSIDDSPLTKEDGQKIIEKYLKLDGLVKEAKNLTEKAKAERAVNDIL